MIQLQVCNLLCTVQNHNANKNNKSYKMLQLQVCNNYKECYKLQVCDTINANLKPG